MTQRSIPEELPKGGGVSEWDSKSPTPSESSGQSSIAPRFVKKPDPTNVPAKVEGPKVFGMEAQPKGLVSQ